jgi:lipooligosaccharide transport system permease protein
VVSYTAFIAPAMLASSAMNGALYDATFNVFFKLKYDKLYDSILSTPVTPVDIAAGEIGWALLRGAFYSGTFFVVMLAMGLVSSWWAVLVLPAAILIGFAFAAVGMACTTFMKSWQDFEYITLATLPMFLFSATFYPLSVYPSSFRWVVEISPLYHAAALIRELTTGAAGMASVGHAVVLVALGVAGVWVAGRRLEKLLLK